MKKELTDIRDQQQAAWSKFSSGWKKWDELTMEWLKPMGDEIIRLLNPDKNAVILDVASGTGEPGLSIASIVTEGKVVMTDLSADMLAIASENAASKGILNIETKVCDVCELPFPDNSFDAISCRFGFMFFPDMLLAAREMVRVLKPGGNIATTVWGVPEKNFWVTATMDVLQRHLQPAPKAAGAPGIFRCAADGLLTAVFQQAGLKNITQSEIEGKINCKTTAVYWNLMTEIAAPIVAELNKATEEQKEKIKGEAELALNQKYPDGNILVDSCALAIYGEK